MTPHFLFEQLPSQPSRVSAEGDKYDPPGLTVLRVTTATAPLGSMAQVKVLLTTPVAIASGTVSFRFDGLVLGASTTPFIAATAFSATGDAYGYGHVDTLGGLVFRFASPLGGLGRRAPHRTLDAHG